MNTGRMFWTMLKGAFIRQKGKMFMIACTIALGTSLATAMLNVVLDVGDKVNQELKTYGANINVVPLLNDLYSVDDTSNRGGKYLQEDELGRLKTIFWAFNIVDFAPYLRTNVNVEEGNDVSLVGTWFDHRLDLPTGEFVDTGIRNMKSWWQVDGAWIGDADTDSCMVGSMVAKRNGLAVGDTITLTDSASTGAQATKKLIVKGIVNAGSEEDEKIFVPLTTVQTMLGRPGVVDQVEVSALTTPDNDLARKAAVNPNSLSSKEWETWYCTAYVSSIAYQIEEVIPDAVAKPIRQVAESEGAILEKTQLLMLLITLLSLIGVVLGISNLISASVMERSKEIGLFKAVGASSRSIVLLFLTEIMITAVVGGVVGYFLGLGFAQIIGHTVFGAAITIQLMVIPIVSILVFIVTLAGSIPSIRNLLSLRPSVVLQGR
jgi:putative ABC transport system permease protein